MGQQISVLALDDDQKFVMNLQHALKERFSIHAASNLEEATEILSSHAIDAIILDYSLDPHDGHAVMDTLRKNNHQQPVVVVSGVIHLEMTIGFLKRRVYGFLEKPVSLPELEALLVEAAQRPISKSTGSAFEIDAQKRTVSYEGQTVGLTPTEFEILMFFISRRAQQVLRSEITSHLWGNTKVTRHAFDTHLLNLKKKLPPFAQRLVSVYGTGYCYDE